MVEANKAGETYLWREVEGDILAVEWWGGPP